MKPIGSDYYRITTKTPAVFVFVLDMSESMLERIPFYDNMRSKADVVSIMVNRTLSEILNRSTREKGCRDYFRIAVLGYCANRVEPLLSSSDGSLFLTSSQIDGMESGIVYYDVPRVLSDGTRYMTTVSQRQWIKPKAEGNTPMLKGLEEAARLVSLELKEYPSSVAPIIFNITDGEASDASSAELRAIAEKIKSLGNKSGNVTLFNIHISSDSSLESVVFPCDGKSFETNSYAELLFSMSSVMPERYSRSIAELTNNFDGREFRAMSFNASFFELFQMLSIGTVSSTFM